MATNEDDEAGRESLSSSDSLGAKLKSAREAQELSFEVISAELRISVPLLNSLEDGEYEALGPPVFAKGYLKQYGARLGLNVPELVADYEKAVGKQDIDIAPSQTITLRDDRQITVWVVAALVLALISAVIWFWWWLGTDRAEVPAAIFSDGAADAPAQTRVAEPEAIARQSVPAAPPPAVLQSANETDDAGSAAVAADDTEPVPESSIGIETELAAETELEAAPEPEPEPQLAAEPGLESEPYFGPELEVVFLADSWTEITAESGDRLFYDLGRAGTIATVPADRDMNLFFGNAAAVALTIDGEPYSIPASARRRGNTAQWDLAARVGESGPDPDIDE